MQQSPQCLGTGMTGEGGYLADTLLDSVSYFHDTMTTVIPLRVSGIYAKIFGEIRNFSVFCLVLAKDLHETLPIWLL
ncbi:hypothetical protein [Wolbachia endosymbiont of Psylliodes chrysocephala]|uniref:hypothetical protein n=1 Tax=Wolbachia endosymbiont of Psylliodes chrysocephala TaxID=2883236 RepID=UPI0020A0C649|nr:hypothetical protein [Wolbachia endosymbiont of Psylliodes chrysocephala]